MSKTVKSKSKSGMRQTRIEDIEDKFEPMDDYELDSYYDVYDFGPPHM